MECRKQSRFDTKLCFLAQHRTPIYLTLYQIYRIDTEHSPAPCVVFLNPNCCRKALQPVYSQTRYVYCGKALNWLLILTFLLFLSPKLAFQPVSTQEKSITQIQYDMGLTYTLILSVVWCHAYCQKSAHFKSVDRSSIEMYTIYAALL